ncbi:MAG: IPT/TIG domain-containing protein [Actinobacteria bacterium]|jgi:hypothetical protein|nr:IPT/TIG domain-containing protein [Actinomycetota bacterium]
MSNTGKIKSKGRFTKVPESYLSFSPISNLFYMFAVVLLSSATMLYIGGAQPASASSPTWSAPTKIIPTVGSGYLASVSCPTTTFCAAVDDSGYALTYNGSTWSTPLSVDGNNILYSVSCPTTIFCMAVDDSGNSLTYGGSIQGGPTATGITPAVGPKLGGTSVTISGSGFTGATAVDFGSKPATSFTVDSDTSITAVSPPGTGTVSVTVTTANGTSNGVNYTYTTIGYTSVSPYRICDTRASNGTSIKTNQCDTKGTTPIGTKSGIQVQVAGYNSPYLGSGETPVPAGAIAVVLNVTAIGGTSPSYLSVCPGGEASSTCLASSNLNFVAGQSITNFVTAGLNSSGDIEVYNFSGSVNVAVDVVGWYG